MAVETTEADNPAIPLLKKISVRLTGLSRIALLCLWIVIAMSQLGRFHWLFDLFSHFYWHYAMVSIVVSLGLWGSRVYFRLSLITSLILIALIGWLYIHPAKPAARKLGQKIRIVSSNVLTSNPNKDRVLDFLKSSDADVIVLMEVSQPWVDAMTPLHDLYPHHYAKARPDNFGIAIYSRIPWERLEVKEFDSSEVPSLMVDWKGANEITLIATHPLPPISNLNTSDRNQHFQAIAKLASERKGPMVVIGDLNCTSWSPHFQKLLSTSKLIDSRRGFGVQGSWPASLWPLRIPIDHALVSSDLHVVDRRLGEPIGSDHLPLVLEVE